MRDEDGKPQGAFFEAFRKLIHVAQQCSGRTVNPQ